MQSAQNGGLGVWESQVRIAVAHLISTENWESRSASVTMFSHSEMEMLSTYTHHCREAKLWGHPGTQSPSQQKTPVILSCWIKFSCRRKYRRLTKAGLCICTSPSSRKNLVADVTVSFPLLFPLRFNALEISTQVPSAFPGHRAIKTPEAWLFLHLCNICFHIKHTWTHFSNLSP